VWGERCADAASGASRIDASVAPALRHAEGAVFATESDARAEY
jgi:hypothetical protein